VRIRVHIDVAVVSAPLCMSATSIWSGRRGRQGARGLQY
jgi:hypothetical protein